MFELETLINKLNLFRDRARNSNYLYVKLIHPIGMDAINPFRTPKNSSFLCYMFYKRKMYKYMRNIV